MGISMIKKALLFIVIISSFFIGVPLANDKSLQKKEGQILEQKLNVINETKENSKEKENYDKNKFDFSPLITIIGIFVSASLIIWQMGRQYKNKPHRTFVWVTPRYCG